MYAIFESGSKQYKVSPGDLLKVEKLEQKSGTEAVLKNVLIIYDKELHLGSPYLEKARVVCDVIQNGFGPKITMFKLKRRKGSRRKRGHRQPFTLLKVKEIHLEASPITKKERAPKKVEHGT